MYSLKIQQNGENIELLFYNTKPTKTEQTEKQKNDSRDYLTESVSRSKRAFIEYGQNNNFNYFGTITFDLQKVDRNDKQTLKSKLLNAFRNYRRLDKDFYYLVAPEYHIDSEHIHFHGLFHFGETSDLLRRYDYKKKLPYFRSDYFFLRFGANRFELISTSSAYSSFYCSKYITKSNQRIFNCSYFCSHGLKTATELKKIDDIEELKTVHRTLFGQNDLGAVYEPTFSNNYVQLYKFDETTFDILFKTLL